MRKIFVTVALFFCGLYSIAHETFSSTMTTNETQEGSLILSPFVDIGLLSLRNASILNSMSVPLAAMFAI